MRLMVVGEDRVGALLRSLVMGLDGCAEVTVVDPAPGITDRVDRRTAAASAHRRLHAGRAGRCLVEAVEQMRPDITLILKGRGIGPDAVTAVRAHTRVAIYYPDNPFWSRGDTGHHLARLAAADLVIIWSVRLRGLLAGSCRRVETVPFGYDDRWFPVSPPDDARDGVVFLGTRSPRRERYLRALEGLPVTVAGSGWEDPRRLGGLRAGSGPICEGSAGRMLAGSAIALNILHPHNAGAHNMRTREIAASGALQLTDPGIDGTPLRDGEGCRWFSSPAHLRAIVEWYLTRPDEGAALAARAQQLVAGDTYRQRAREIFGLLERVA